MENNQQKYVFCVVAFFVVAIGAFTVGSYLTQSRDPFAEVAFVASPEEQAEQINRYRRARGLPLLRRSDRLEREALRTARANAQKERLFHLGGNEIIAYNYSGFQEAVDQWDKSTAGHHEMLNDRKFRRVGCACVFRNGRFYSCARFE